MGRSSRQLVSGGPSGSWRRAGGVLQPLLAFGVGLAIMATVLLLPGQGSSSVDQEQRDRPKLPNEVAGDPCLDVSEQGYDSGSLAAAGIEGAKLPANATKGLHGRGIYCLSANDGGGRETYVQAVFTDIHNSSGERVGAVLFASPQAANEDWIGYIADRLGTRRRTVQASGATYASLSGAGRPISAGSLLATEGRDTAPRVELVEFVRGMDS